MPTDRQRLKKIKKPVPTSTPVPSNYSSTPTPIPAPENPTTVRKREKFERFSQGVARAFTKVLGEATPAQRQLLKDVTPKAVESIGTVGGKEVAGRTYYPAPGRTAAIVTGGLQAVGAVPQSGIRISQKAKGQPIRDVVRHEAAHATLFKSNVPVGKQHDIMKLARFPTGPKEVKGGGRDPLTVSRPTQLSLRALPTAVRASKGDLTAKRQLFRKQQKSREKLVRLGRY